MRRLLGVCLLFLAFSAFALAQTRTSNSDTSKQQGTVQKTLPQEKEVGAASAPASVKLNTPTLNMDVLLDLYNKDIDFTIDYSGKSLQQRKQPSGEENESQGESERQKKQASDATNELLKPRAEDLTSDIQDIVDTSKTRRKPAREGTYTKEDADYNKALYSLQEAQRLFSERRYQQALVEINKSVDAAPNMALAYAVRGSIFYMLRQFPEAKQSWERALELDPSMDNVRAILYRM